MIVVIGGGLCGALTAMLLADDGHRVTVLERDPAEPPVDPRAAWASWERRSIRQFHVGHFFLSRFRAELEAHLPRVAEAMADAGALVGNPIVNVPEGLTGGWRDGDERFGMITGRRPVIEAVVAKCAANTDGVSFRRGVAVTGLVTTDDGGDADVDAGVAHIVGVQTEGGEVIMADLVVDAAGRGSALPRMLVAAGAAPPVDETDDSGFVYYGRSFRSDVGALPASFGAGLQAYGSISTLTLPADNGTWQIAFVASGKDAVMRKVRDEARFNELWRSYPLVAHWIDAEPISDIAMIGNLEDRIRHFVVDGRPIATGIAPVGDSWACTNPSVGRGASIGLVHSVALRDHVRTASTTDRVEWAVGWSKMTEAVVEPYYRETVRADRHRLREVEAAIAGDRYETADPRLQFGDALAVAAFADPDAFRAWLDTFMLFRTTAEVMADAALVDKVLSLGGNPGAGPGPDRAGLEAILA